MFLSLPGNQRLWTLRSLNQQPSPQLNGLFPIQFNFKFNFFDSQCNIVVHWDDKRSPRYGSFSWLDHFAHSLFVAF